VANWTAHNKALRTRMNWLNGKRFQSLHFKGPGTDLIVGLADGHEWRGGQTTAKNGATGNCNIPTEEVFTCPHRLMTEGTVSATKTLKYGGNLLEGIRIRFEKGRIVEAHATKNEEILKKLIGTDEGSHFLGEVALVPHSSPISKSGLLYLETLFDENAADHIAIGNVHKKTVTNGVNMSKDELASCGANYSLVHVDWMIGSDKVDVDGVYASGEREPIKRQGEFVNGA
jgi:aminopeptidase